MNPKNKQPRLAGFDAAGTLILLNEPVGETYSRFARERGVSLPPARLEDGFRRIFREMPPMTFPGQSPDETRQSEKDWWQELVRRTFRATDSTILERHFQGGFSVFFETLWEYYSGPAGWSVRPEAPAALTELQSAGWTLAVLSNFDHRLDPLLEQFGLSSFFHFTLRSSAELAPKPDLDLFHEARRRSNVTASRAVYIGDDPDHDLEAARKSGWKTLDAKTTSWKHLALTLEKLIPDEDSI